MVYEALVLCAIQFLVSRQAAGLIVEIGQDSKRYGVRYAIASFDPLERGDALTVEFLVHLVEVTTRRIAADLLRENGE